MSAGAGLVLLMRPGGIAEFPFTVTASIGSLAAILAFYVSTISSAGPGRNLAHIYCWLFSVQVFFVLTRSLGEAEIVGIWGVFYSAQYMNLFHTGSLVVVCAYLLGGVVMARAIAGFNMMFAITVGGTLVGLACLPFFVNPNYLYTFPAITDFRIVDRAKTELLREGKDNADPKDIADRISLSRWGDLERAGELGFSETLARVEELFPYLEGENHAVLICRPLYKTIAQLSLWSIAILAGFFLINYLRDPPKPAHFEKIHFTLFAYTVFEYFHASTLLKATTFEEFVALDRIGKYLTAAVLITFIGLFLVRARFLSRSLGVFYEEKLTADPGGISRWRDGIDNFLIRNLFAKQKLKNRFLLQRPEEK